MRMLIKLKRGEKMRNRIIRLLILSLVIQTLYVPNVLGQDTEVQSIVENLQQTSHITTREYLNLAPEEFRPFEYAIFSGSDEVNLKYSGWKMFVEGDIHTNKDFEANCTELEINGNCEAVGSVKVDGYLQGIQQSTTGAALYVMPDFYERTTEVLKDEAEVYHGSTYFNSPEINLDSSIIVNGSVHFDTINVNGKGYVLAQEDINFNINNLKNISDTKVCYYSKEGNIVINASNVELNGIFYAPNGKIILNGYDIKINGRIIANEVVLNASLINITASSSDFECINLPPMVEAGENQTVSIKDGVVLNGEVEDEGLLHPVIVEWTVISGPGSVKFENTNSCVTVAEFTQPGEYVLALSADDGQYQVSDTVTITVEAPKIEAVIDVSGELKQNRTVILDSTQSSAGDVAWEVEPLGQDVTQEDIKWENGINTGTIQKVLFKKPGVYRVTLKVQADGVVEKVEKEITIEEDLAPIADFSVDSVFYREAAYGQKARVPLKDLSYSSDGDVIGKRIWTVKYDKNNDGIFEDEQVISDTNEKETIFLADKVGKYQVELQVVEEIKDTLPGFLVEEDYLKGDTRDKISSQKLFVVENQAPASSVQVNKAKMADVVFTVGRAEFDKITEFSSYIDQLENSIKAQGVDLKLSTVSTSSLTAQDSFAWEVYDHSNYKDPYGPLIPSHITVEGNDIKMLGYTVAALKDFLFVPNDNQTQKTFTFEMQRDGTNWHSMEGGGFLFNTSIVNGKIQGFCVLVTQGGVKLNQIKGVDLTKFRNGSYNLVQQAGVNLKTFKGLDPYVNHQIKIVVDRSNISMWDNGQLIIDQYQLPENDYGFGFGPITSHVGHGCGQRSYFTFKNIKMETVVGKSLDQVLREYEWREGAERFVVNLSDELLPDLETEEQIADVATILLQKQLRFIGLGQEVNKDQYKALLDAYASEGLYQDTTELRATMQNLESYLLSTVLSKDYSVEHYVVAEEKVDYIDAYLDKEQDPVYSYKWEYVHDPSIFENATGIIEDSGKERQEAITTFDKVGAYGIKLKVRDNPVGDNNALDEYRKWSDENSLQKALVVHRRPFAEIKGSTTLNKNNPTMAYINTESNSYDLDHLSEANKGITSRIYKWKNIKDTTWTSGNLPNQLPIDEIYLAYYQVEDKEGGKSLPAIAVISTKGLVKPQEEIDKEVPEVSIILSKQSARVGEEIVVEVLAKDNIGVDLLEIYIDGELASTNKNTITFNAHQTDVIKVEAVATDAVGNVARAADSCKIISTGDRIAPIARINIPKAGATLVVPTQIVGTAKDETGIKNYQLAYRVRGESDFKVFAEGTGAKDNEVLATLDPTYWLAGDYDIRLYVQDTSGNISFADTYYHIMGNANPDIDIEKPQVTIELSKDKAEIGESVTATIKVTDNKAIKAIEVYFNEELVSTQPGIITFSRKEAELVKIRVKAVDTSDNETTEEAVCQIIDTRDQIAPTAQITSPLMGSTLFGKVDFIGTATDETQIECYRLEYRKQGAEEYITIVESSESKTDEVLGQLDVRDLTPGVYEVRLSVKDKGGNNAYIEQGYVISNIINPNDTIPPTATITFPDEGAIIKAPTQILGTVQDDLAVYRYLLQYRSKTSNGYVTLVDAKSMEEEGVLGTFDPTGLPNGSYEIRLTVEDEGGNKAVASKNYLVGEDTEPPVVEITLSQNVVEIDQPIVIYVAAKDNVEVKKVALYIDGQEVALENNRATITPKQAKIVQVEAVAVDISGNEAREKTSYQVIDLGDKVPPQAEIILPENETNLTAPTKIIGTVKDNKALERYYLQYRLVGTEDFTIFAEATSEMGQEEGLPFKENEILGEFDPTALKNGLYEIQLVAIDRGGNICKNTGTYTVSGDMKIGQMNIGFTDITANISGLNMSVTRQYSSFNKEKGDFGVGWTLGLNSIQMYEGSKLGANWEHIQKKAYPFPSYSFNPTTSHDVVITYGDGTSDTFEVVLDYKGQTPIVPIRILDATYRCKTNSKVKLEIVGNKTMECIGSLGATTFFPEGEYYSLDQPMDPQVFKLTTEDGTQIILHKQNGIQSITDKNGNQITIDKKGITSSNGKSIIFTRDSEDRIITATDLAGNATRYVYDNNGDLVEVVNPLDQSVKFVYDNKHNLAQIIDPRGIAIARNEYDENGRLVAIIDALGNRTEYTRDVDTRVEIIKDRRGNTTELIYDEKGNVLSHKDALGNVTNYSYDQNGNMLTEINALGGMTAYTYDKDNRLTALTDELGNQYKYEYDADGNMTKETNPAGMSITSQYDEVGNLTEYTDNKGNTTHLSYNSKGQLTSVTDATGNTIRNFYDSNGNVIKEESSDGTVTKYTYDSSGNCLSTTLAITTKEGTKELITTYEYDACNRRIKTISPEGNTEVVLYNELGLEEQIISSVSGKIVNEYDDMGNVTRTIYPDLSEERRVYDIEGNEISFTDRLGNVTKYEYDALGRQTKMIFADGTSNQMVYDEIGQLKEKIDENGNVTQYTYDPMGRNIAVTDALGNTTQYEYGLNNNKTKMIDAKGQEINFSYNEKGLLVNTVLPDKNTIRYGYNEMGIKISETDQTGKTTYFEYNDQGKLVSVKDAQGNTTEYAYDNKGNLISQKDANGNETRFEYDYLNRRTKRILPLGMSESYEYGTLGELKSISTFNGDKIAFEYNQFGELMKKIYPDGTFEGYTYDANGQIKTITTQQGVTKYNYDARGRVTRKIMPDQTSLAYTYDGVGNRTSMTMSSGTIYYEYDKLNRLVKVADAQGEVTTYNYDNIGNTTDITYPNGNNIKYEYNNMNRLVKQTNKKSDGSLISSYEYVLGPIGNRLQVTENTGRTVKYSYDDTYKLIGEQIITGQETREITYDYDAVGNRLMKNDNGQVTKYVYDANDRLLAENEKTYSYDQNGNILLEKGNTTVSYEYDYGNHLIKVNNGQNIVEYTYDSQGIRIGKKVNNDEIKYLVDDMNPYAQVVEERDSKGELIVSYTYGNDLISQNRKGTKHYYIYDGHGNTRALTDVAENITDTYNYDAFGIMIDKQGDTVNNYLYCGEQYDANVGFYYLRARYMNPNTGRFFTMDTYEGNGYDPVSLHKYLYCNAEPINNIDPSGYYTLAELAMTQDLQSMLAPALQNITRFMKVVEKVTNVVDIINSINAVFNVIYSGNLTSTLSTIFTQPTGRFAQVFNSSFWEDAVATLASNSSKIFALALTKKATKLLKMYKKPNSAFIIYMPSPEIKTINISALLPTGMKIRDKKVKLFFGPPKRTGRLIGFGMIPHESKQGDNFQVFRMDYHIPNPGHKPSDGYWSSGQFHFHVEEDK